MLLRFAEFVARIADRKSTILIAGVIAGLAFGVFDFFVDRSMNRLGVAPDIHATAQAAFVGVGAGIASLWLLVARRQRRKLIQEQLFRVAELNHRLRNSLQIIVDSHHAENDQVQQQMIFETVASINDTLRQLFPTLGFERRQGSRTSVVAMPARRPERRTS